MTMTGKNGINIKPEKLIVLFDSSASLDEIKSIFKSKRSVIISLNHPSFEILKKNNIPQISPDEFLTQDEMEIIQKSVYELSDWYSKKPLNDILMYNDVNLGSLVQAELINILVNFLKNFYTLYKITLKYPDYKFVCSKNTSIILEKFSKKFNLLNTAKTSETLPLDLLNTNFELKFKNLSLKLKIDSSKLHSLQSLSENFSNLLLKSHINKNSKYFLFSEINTKKFSNLFQEMASLTDNYVIYNRRYPSIWDKESFQLIKKSKILLENEKTLNQNLDASQRESLIKNILKKLANQNEIFEKFFIINNMPFWLIFKEIFYKLLKKRFFDYSYEIDLCNNLLKKYPFNAILLQNEIGPNEQILLQLGKSKNIPILLLQHGLIFDTNEAFIMNRYQGVLGRNSDYQLVWGDVDYQYRKKLGFNPEKIIKIGSPTHDRLFNNENSRGNYILLATSGPTTEDVFDLSVKSNTKNIETIMKISKIVTSLNHKLLIKIHPSPDEFDPTELVRSINPDIQVIKTGNISNLIKNCSMMIVIDFSSVILDGHLLQKPVISIPVKNNNYGVPTAFNNNSCLIANLENLEQTILRIIKNENLDIIKNGTTSAQRYLSNPGKASKKLLSFLSTNQITD